MDKYDEMYATFMRKANVLGMDVKFEKQKNKLYKLIAIDWVGSTLTLQPFVGKIDHLALRNCPNLVELYLPDTLTSLDICFENKITKYNIPGRIKGIHRFGSSVGKLEITLEGCRKSVQRGFSAGKTDFNIINSHLIERVNGRSFFQYRDAVTNIKELRLLDTFIESSGFHHCNIKKLYLSKYSNVEPEAFKDCIIDELYFFVETQEEADKINNIAYNETYKLKQFSSCKISKLEVIVKTTLKSDIRSLMTKK